MKMLRQNKRKKGYISCTFCLRHRVWLKGKSSIFFLHGQLRLHFWPPSLFSWYKERWYHPVFSHLLWKGRNRWHLIKSRRTHQPKVNIFFFHPRCLGLLPYSESEIDTFNLQSTGYGRRWDIISSVIYGVMPLTGGLGRNCLMAYGHIDISLLIALDGGPRCADGWASVVLASNHQPAILL